MKMNEGSAYAPGADDATSSKSSLSKQIKGAIIGGAIALLILFGAFSVICYAVFGSHGHATPSSTQQPPPPADPCRYGHIDLDGTLQSIEIGQGQSVCGQDQIDVLCDKNQGGHASSWFIWGFV